MSTTERDPLLRINKLGKTYPAARGSTDRVVILKDIELDIARGEFITVIGPSGCGKTTLMDCVAGLTKYDSGSIEIDGSRVEGPGPDRAVVFQQSSLLPWRTIERNVAYGGEMLRWDKTVLRQRVQEAIDVVGLGGYEKHHPHQLSGGMQQRANLARALVLDAPVVLMDEPFGALDAMTKKTMQDELLAVSARIGSTVIFITHDIEEAVYLGDRVVLLRPRPGEVDTVYDVPFARPRPRELVDSPEFRALTSELSHRLQEVASRRTTSDGGPGNREEASIPDNPINARIEKP